MELGKAKLRRRGINLLSNAVYKNDDVLWTDGQTVYLSSLRQCKTQAETKSLGLFQEVVSIGWCQCPARDIVYIVQRKNVIISALVEQEGRLKLTTLKEISITVLPQGVLWNSVGKTLCLTSSSPSSSLLLDLTSLCTLSLCDQPNKFPAVTCGCWSLDGSHLYLAASTSDILVYELAADKLEIKFNLTLPTRCSGTVAVMSPLIGDRLLCTSDMPVSTLNQGGDSLFMISSDGASCRNSSNADSELQLGPVSQKCNQSQLLLLDMKKMKILDSVDLKGILYPDILATRGVRSNEEVTVGSNTCSILQVFLIAGNKISTSRVINVEENERAKGLIYSDETLLIVTGTSHLSSTLSIPTTLFTEYQLCLKYETMNSGNMCNETPLASSSSNSLVASTEGFTLQTDIHNSNISDVQLPPQRLIVDLSRDNEPEEPLEIEQVTFNNIPSRFVNDLERLMYDTPRSESQTISSTSADSWISDVTQSTAATAQTSLRLARTITRSTADAITRSTTTTTATHLTQAVYQNATDELCRNHTQCCCKCAVNVRGVTQDLRRELELLKLQLANKERMTATNTVLNQPNNYNCIERTANQTRPRGLRRADDPDVVELCVTEPSSISEVRVRATFLLDDCRLKLEVVRKAFNLANVRLWIGDKRTCYLSEDSQGYIPLLFSPDRTYFITDS